MSGLPAGERASGGWASGGPPSSGPPSSAELRSALDQALAEAGARARIASLERRPCAFATSFALEELRVQLEGGTRLELMFKDLGEGGLSERARAAKPRFLYDPLREIETYRSILSSAELGTPAFHGASVSASEGRYWLFIENVHGTALWQVGELETWREVARWAARLHASHCGAAAPANEHLIRYDRGYLRLWLERAVEFADRWEERRPGVARRGIERLASRYDEVVERLAALPATFIHGELYASNVLVAKGGWGAGSQQAGSQEAGLEEAAQEAGSQAGSQAEESVRVSPIDWELAAVGPGLVDLAALVMGWGDAERAALADAYREALEAGGGGAAPEDFLRALDCARLHLAVQWLGWAPDWRPPRSHRRDWVGEALGIAESLGL